MIIWSVILAGVLALLFYSTYPRPDFVATVYAPTYATPIIDFVNAHKMTRQYVYDNTVITGIDTEVDFYDSTKGNVVYPDLTNLSDKLKPYLPDGPKNDLTGISALTRCLNHEGTGLVSCNVRNSSDYLMTYTTPNANWDQKYPGWKKAFIKQTNQNAFCGFIKNATTLSTARGDFTTQYPLTGGGGSPQIGDLACLSFAPYYTPTGQVLYYDGLNNTGAGHSDTTTKWVNLTGQANYDITEFSLNNFKWYPDAIAYHTFQNYSVLDTHLDPNIFNGSWTIESAFDNTQTFDRYPSTGGLIFGTGLFAVGSTAKTLLFSYIPTQIPGYNYFISTYLYDKAALKRTINWSAFMLKGTVVVSVDDKTHSTYWDNTFYSPAITLTTPYQNTSFKQTLSLMNASTISNFAVNGRLHFTRVYSQPLTDAERTRHYEIDEIRYYLTRFDRTKTTTRGYIDADGILRSKGDTSVRRGLVIVPINDTTHLRAGQTYRIINPKCIENPTFVIGYWNGASEPATNAQLTNVETIEGTNALITIPAGARYLVVYTHDSTLKDNGEPTEMLETSTRKFDVYCSSSNAADYKNYTGSRFYIYQERNDS